MTHSEDRQTLNSPVDGLTPVQVECYAGFRGQQRPKCYKLADEALVIMRVLTAESIEWSPTGERFIKFTAIDQRSHRIVLWHNHVADLRYLDKEV